VILLIAVDRITSLSHQHSREVLLESLSQKGVFNPRPKEENQGKKE
jgi:hypothetical protein